MYKHIFGLIEDVAQYPIVSLLVFFVFFILLGVRVLTMKKDYTKRMGRLPLDDSQPASTTTPSQLPNENQ